MTFDIIVLCSLGIFGFFGLRNGLIDELATLIGFILAIMISAGYYHIGTEIIQGIFDVNESFGMVLGFIIVFLAVYLTCRLIAWALQSFIKMVKLEWLNKIAGLIFGAFKGIVIMASVVWIISVFNNFDWEKNLSQRSVSYNLLKNLTQTTAEFFHYDDDLMEMAHALRSLFGLETEKVI